MMLKTTDAVCTNRYISIRLSRSGRPKIIKRESIRCHQGPGGTTHSNQRTMVESLERHSSSICPNAWFDATNTAEMTLSRIN